MARTVLLDGNLVTIETEIIERFNIDNELDTKELIIKDSTLLEPYDTGLLVEIIEDSVNEKYIIGQDKPVLSGRDPDTYNHRITLIEYYKDIERKTIASLQFTQPINGTKYTLLDVLDRTLKLYRLEEVSNLGANRVYDIEGIGIRDVNDNYVVGNLSGFALDLYNRKAPNIEFETPTIREIFDYVGELMDGRIYIDDADTIAIRYYNAVGNEITDYNEYTGEQSINDNAQKYDMYIENAVSEANVNKQARVYPSTNGWGSVRSSEVALTTSNFLMEVAEDIERVLEFKVYVDVRCEYRTPGSGDLVFDDVIEVDMTSHLFTKRAWDALDYNYNSDIGVDGTTWWNYPNKTNSLYIQGNQILGWHEDLEVWNIWGTSRTWNAFLSSAVYEGGYLPSNVSFMYLTTGNKPSFSTDVQDFMFRLKYVPKEKVRMQIERADTNGFGEIYYNQTDRVIDIEALGKQALSTISRKGAKLLKFTKRFDSFKDTYQIGDYYGDYKVIKVENSRKSQFTLSTATLSKNYVKKSERIAQMNQIRQTEISAVTTERNDLIHHYTEASFTVDTSKSNYLTSLGVQRYIDTFRDVPVQTNAVEMVTWDNELLLEATSFGTANTLVFKFGFDNNIVAGEQIIQQGSPGDLIYSEKYVEYAPNGLKDTVQMKFYGNFVATTPSYANYASIAQKLPEYDSSVTLQENYITIPEIQILKDSGEIYAFTYQTTTYTNESEIFIGQKLSTDNALVVANPQQLYLYTSDNDIPFAELIDTTLTKQTIVTGTPADTSEVKLLTLLALFSGEIRFTTNFNNKKWAIADSNGNTYLICNKTNQDRIYFNNKKERD